MCFPFRLRMGGIHRHKITRTCELINLVSSHEATRSFTTPPLMECQSISWSPSPPPPLTFLQASLTNFCYPFILLSGEGHCDRKVFCTRTKHMTWSGYKCRPIDTESSSQIIRPPCLHKRSEFMLNTFS